MKHKILFFSIVFFLAMPAQTSAQVSTIVFTTQLQSVTPGSVSEQITIQAQDANGTPVSGGVPQTACVLLASAPPGGQFSSSATTWNPVFVLTMNKSTANRSFFYKSSAEGAQVLSAKLVLKPEDESRSCANWPVEEWGTGWSATQNITIGATSPQTDEQASTTHSEVQKQEQTAGSASVPAITACITAHAQVSVGAGSLFEGAAYGLKGEPLGANVRYIWNFGDGVVAEGKSAFHSYAYPGSYVVTLTVGYHYYSGHARLTVLAAAPQVALLTEGDGSLTVANQSDKELNIGNWSLRGSGGLFIIPPDTFVLAQSGVRFAPEVLRFSGSPESQLYFSNGVQATVAKHSLTSPLRGEPVSTAEMSQYTQQPVLFEIPEGVDIHAPALPAEEGEVQGASTEIPQASRGSSKMLWGSLAALVGVLGAGMAGMHFARPRQQQKETFSEADEFEIED